MKNSIPPLQVFSLFVNFSRWPAPGGQKPFSAEPSPSGGQSLLQLLQKTPSTTPPSQSDLSPHSHSHLHDPAVAAVGPSHPFPPWPTDLRPPPLSDPRFAPSPYSFSPVFPKTLGSSPHAIFETPPPDSPIPTPSAHRRDSPRHQHHIDVRIAQVRDSRPQRAAQLELDGFEVPAVARPSKDAAAPGRSSRAPQIRPQEKGLGAPWQRPSSRGAQRPGLMENRKLPPPPIGHSRKPKGPKQWSSANGRRDGEHGLEKGEFSMKLPLTVQLDKPGPPEGEGSTEKGFWPPAKSEKTWRGRNRIFRRRAFLDICPAGVQLGSGPNSGQRSQANRLIGAQNQCLNAFDWNL